MIYKTIALISIWSILTVHCLPTVTDTSSLVVSTTEQSDQSSDEKLLLRLQSYTEKSDEKGEAPVVPKIYALDVQTNVTNRYAKTLITSKVKNASPKSQEVAFSVVIPDQAFISGFTMEIDGKRYDAYVQEKQEAKKTYDQAVASGIAAGHVAVSARDSNRFTVSVNIEPEKKAIFYLKYEELLKRENDKYEVVLNINPGQPVKNLDVEVFINETRPLKFVKTPALRSGNEISKNDSNLDPDSNIEIFNQTSALVKFHPDIETQKQLGKNLGKNEENGLSGQFIVQYDVERDPQGGEVLVDGGYFVHFFAPSDIPALPKQVVFILDTSGSMEGIRITQLKEAMNSILSELKDSDLFSIVEFSSIAKVWNIENIKVQYVSGVDPWDDAYTFGGQPNNTDAKLTDQVLPPSIAASPENIEKAKKVVEKLQAYGGTDIQSALETGLKIVATNKDKQTHQPIIVFLTDGEATVGEINNDKIISKISELDSGKAPIFSLSFGDGADRNFLQKISLKNEGFARHIYEAADASLQLQEFYKEISSPLLSNVTFKYVGNVPNDTTRTVFPILFDGGEICATGRIDPGFSPSAVEAWGYQGKVRLVPTVYKAVDSLERLWAYLTVKQILEQRDLAEDKTGPTREALRLALEYSFVTDVSSLVVVKPNETKAVNTEDASVADRYPIAVSGVGCPTCFYAASIAPQAAFASGYGGGQAHAQQDPIAPQAAFVGGYGGAQPLAQNEPLPSQFSGGYGQPEAELLETVIDAGDRIAGGYVPLSTPFLPASAFPTAATVAEDEEVEKLDDLLTIYNQLPWLEKKVFENGTIAFDSGVYKLGLNETLNSHPECTNSVDKAKGTCSLLQKCPEIYPKLDEFSKWEHEYFCEVEKYAGVCCPLKIETQPQPNMPEP